MAESNVVIKDLLKKLADTKGASDLILTEGKPPQLRVYNHIVPLDGDAVLTKQDTEQLVVSSLTEKRSRIEPVRSALAASLLRTTR